MTVNNYELSIIKKLTFFFGQQKISSLVYLYDEDDNEMLDHVIFFEKEDSSNLGLYIRGLNPLFSINKIHELDDFNLFASYEKISEYKEEFKLSIEYICFHISSEYNELLGVYLSNSNNSQSILILFLQDKIELFKNCNYSEARKMLENRCLQEDYISYEKYHTEDWRKLITTDEK
ncbi:hypothetical protein L2089_20765 [Paenibacillus hunanensis]|uniref:hypothetical protein n=1 Tax=Paenibacillus hunanensis TaxID=539262 RepID=UPI0020260820|nr:hypothetical protein [Paenibacillus hunanensis]MCL9663120.1 hypothetical protein [Paenibacillus hunanensis]